MDRLFIDASVLFSASFRSDTPLQELWQLARGKKVELITSMYAVAEVRRNLKTAEQPARLEKLLLEMDVRPLLPSALMPAGLPELPDKDRPILVAAIVAKATHLVTSDLAHFGPFFGKTFHGVMIVSPKGYLRQ